MMRLENWSLCTDPYIAPELNFHYLSGEVYNDPTGRPDGTKIKTSIIEKIDGNVITTTSGRQYLLGKARADYVEWCKKQGCHVPTEQEPIKIKE